MKNKRILSLVLCFVTSLSFLTACKNKKGPESVAPPAPQKVDKNHYHSVKDVDGYFMQSGKSDYKILLPEISDTNIQSAAKDFNYFLKLATGVELPIVYDNKVDLTNGKYISVGNTKLLANSGIKVDSDLTTSGFIVKSKDDDIYVGALSTKSCIYGMQELLSYLINWEYFGTDCYRYDTNVKDIKLQSYDIREVADIEYRYTNYGYAVKSGYNTIRKEKDMLNRSRLEYMYTEITGPGDHVGHNNLYYAPLNKYFEAHPDWYTGDKLNLSYVANGNPKEYRSLVLHVANEMCTILKTYPQNLIMCTIEDSPQFDPCTAQAEITTKYDGACVASIILFLNDVNKEIKAWLATEDGKPYDRDYALVFLAYMTTEKAPARVDANGNVTLIDGLNCDPEVVVQYAPIYQDFMHSIYEEDNKYYLNNLKAWGEVCENPFVWNYVINYTNYFCFYDNFDNIADGIKACKDAGVKYIYHEHGGTGNAANPCWDTLRFYLEMKLGWNSSLDVNDLIDEFFDAYYGEVAPEMKDLFLQNRAWSKYLKDNMNGSKAYDGVYSCQNSIKDAEFWPRQMLMNWLKITNDAEAKITHLKTEDPDKYALLYKHIATERLSFYYLLVELYSKELSAETIMNYKMKFKEDSDYIGGSRVVINGGQSVEIELYPLWGI